jgi:hypothetical protein
VRKAEFIIPIENPVTAEVRTDSTVGIGASPAVHGLNWAKIGTVNGVDGEFARSDVCIKVVCIGPARASG